MISFGEQLYRLVLPKDRLTQPLELLTRYGPVTTSAAGVFEVEHLIYTVPVDRIFVLASFGGRMIPDAGAVESLGIRIAYLGSGGNTVRNLVTASAGFVSAGGIWELGGSCAIPIAPGTGVYVRAVGSVAAAAGHILDQTAIHGWTVPRGSVSL